MDKKFVQEEFEFEKEKSNVIRKNESFSIDPKIANSLERSKELIKICLKKGYNANSISHTVSIMNRSNKCAYFGKYETPSPSTIVSIHNSYNGLVIRKKKTNEQFFTIPYKHFAKVKALEKCLEVIASDNT